MAESSRPHEDAGDDWAQTPHRGRPIVLAVVGVSALIAVLLLLPVPDGPRRATVLGLLAVLIVLQVALSVRARRAGRRPLSPRWLRVAAQGGWMWGFFTGWQYAIPITGLQNGPLASVVSGAVVGLFFGVVMWFADPARPSSSRDRAHREG